MIIILLIAPLIRFIVAYYENDSSAFFVPILIVFIIVVNAIIEVLQEDKAEKVMEALLKLSTPHARVIRDGKDLVTGDIIILQNGNYLPADTRLLEDSSVKVEESPLTGESIPVEKDAIEKLDLNVPLVEGFNIVYSGCSILYDSAKTIITQTDINIDMGKIAQLIDTEIETKTPLQIKLAQLGKYLGVLVIVMCIIIFIMDIVDGMNILEIFMISVLLAVLAISEGLPAVETLGSTLIICSDKTGTYTQNKMTLIKIYNAKENELKDINNANTDSDLKLSSAAVLCCNGDIVIKDDVEKSLGDPTEKGYSKADLNNKFPRVFELPFDSNRKLMSTINVINEKKYVIVKGAYDVLASRCIFDNMDKINDIIIQMGGKALRVLAVDYKELTASENEYDSEHLENILVFAGLLGMIDPSRFETKEAVKQCQQTGIKPIMITDDHVITAGAIAKELGILKNGRKKDILFPWSAMVLTMHLL